MQPFDDQCIITAEYPLPETMLRCLEQAGILFGMPERDIIVQALHEFFEKHGLSCGGIEPL